MRGPLPIKILGIGRYLPSRVVANPEIEQMAGLEPGTIDKSAAGVRERRWISDETNSFMGAEAAREALDDAGLPPGDVDLILNASGTQEHLIPDGGPILQRQLGLTDSGIPCLSVHSTCLSFVVALNVAAHFLAAGQYRNILIVSSDIGSVGLDPTEMESFVLFGDAAAAVVVGRTPEGDPSRMCSYAFHTYGEGAYFTRVLTGTSHHVMRPGADLARESLFHMEGKRVFRVARKHGGHVLERIQPGLSTSLGDIRMAVPHQASGLAIRVYSRYGWPEDRIAVTLDRLGNTIAASIPVTLYEVIRNGRIGRGDKVLLVGTGAGLSIGGTVLVF